jgi:drug/metabolite transporter (DMT)-like permease
VTSHTNVLPHYTDRQKVAIGLLLLCTVLWSLAGVGLKTLFARTDLTATSIGGYRALFAGLSLLPLAWWRGGLRLSRLQPLPWAAIAALLFCPMIWTFVASVGRTTSANAIILMYTAPLWVLLLAPWMTGDHAQRRDLWAAAIGMAGMATIVLAPSLLGRPSSGTETAGMFLALASGLTLAILSMALRRLQQADPIAITCLNNLSTAGLLLPAVAFHGTLRAPWWAILVLAGLGAFQIATPYALYCWCLRWLTPQKATIIMLTEPIMNPLWVWLTIGEVPSWATLLGGAMILGGLVVMISGRQAATTALARRPVPAGPARKKDVPTTA